MDNNTNNIALDGYAPSTVVFAKALSGFHYGGYVTVTIPELNINCSNNKKETKTQKINMNNVMNKDKTPLKPKCKNNTVTSSNTYTLYIPYELYRWKYDYDHSNVPPYKGYAGETFAVSFIGGDLSKPIILRRID